MTDYMKDSNDILKLMMSDHPDINIKIKYSENIIDDAIKLCENKRLRNTFEKRQREENLQTIGTYLFPEKINGSHYILVSNDLIENYEYVATVYHECQHAIDYIDLCIRDYHGDFNEFLTDKIQQSGLFNAWSDFNAYRKEYDVALNITNKLNGQNVDDAKRYILDKCIDDIYFEIGKEVFGQGVSDSHNKTLEVIKILAAHSIYHNQMHVRNFRLPFSLISPFKILDKYKSVLDVEWNEVRVAISRIQRVIVIRSFRNRLAKILKLKKS